MMGKLTLIGQRSPLSTKRSKQIHAQSHNINTIKKCEICSKLSVNIFNPSRPGQREKIKLNFYFQTALWCLKRFYEGLKGLHKTFRGTKKKSENKNLTYIFISIQLSEIQGTGRGVNFEHI